MIILLAASSVSLLALQASINAPREAFRTCLKDASVKAAAEKVAADSYEAYARNACSGQLGTFKGAVIKFDMSNKMSRKASDDDADAMIDDFISGATDHYKYVLGSSSPTKQQASAPAAQPTATPQPIPAAEPKKP
jgi:hypothetical protein